MADLDPRMMKVQPRIRYNTIGGVNGPLVILESVRNTMDLSDSWDSSLTGGAGQISQVQ